MFGIGSMELLTLIVVVLILWGAYRLWRSK
jgi:Sec-independent protein translocase protein TatA